jgi:hypothetical protein
MHGDQQELILSSVSSSARCHPAADPNGRRASAPSFDMVASSYAGAAHALGHLQPPSLRPFFLDTAVQADLRPSGFVPVLS